MAFLAIFVMNIMTFVQKDVNTGDLAFVSLNASAQGENGGGGTSCGTWIVTGGTSYMDDAIHETSSLGNVNFVGNGTRTAGISVNGATTNINFGQTLKLGVTYSPTVYIYECDSCWFSACGRCKESDNKVMVNCIAS